MILSIQEETEYVLSQHISFRIIKSNYYNKIEISMSSFNIL